MTRNRIAGAISALALLAAPAVITAATTTSTTPRSRIRAR